MDEIHKRGLASDFPFESLRLFKPVDSLEWGITPPSNVRKGSTATLEWTISLTKEERPNADRFSLIIVEREKFLYSDEWQIMAVKGYASDFHQKVGNEDTFDMVPGKDVAFTLKNVTDTDATRFRCTFLSSFAAPKSIIQVEMKGKCMSNDTPYKRKGPRKFPITLSIKLILDEKISCFTFLFTFVFFLYIINSCKINILEHFGLFLC